MKKVVGFLTNKWVIGIIGLIALSLLIWFGADFVKFGEDNATLSTTTRFILIGLCVVAWVVYQLITTILELRRNNGLIEEIAEVDNEENPDDVRTREELQAISERFKDAMQVLKKSRFQSNFGKKSLYQLPWYIIIGPPGAGKTTALVNSGLEFPLAQSHGKESIGGIGGTRNCDWWFTNESIIIDTAGRYTTQDSHRVVDNTAWQKFLALLKKYRKRRPINGVLLAISLQDIMTQTPEQRLQQAKTLRTRINELQQQLGIRFPIYLTFTKCDLVAGFSEFFENLSQAECEQVWGVSFSPEGSPNAGTDLSEFKPEYEKLVERLNQRILVRLNQERNVDKRYLLQSFPARMDSIGHALNDFVTQIFAANRYETTPLVRGVYFTSATQEGSPIDRMMSSISSTFGLERDQGQQQRGTGKSFFITRLLNDVIFPESELVGVNRTVERTMVWMRRAGYGGIAALLGASTLTWVGSITQNKLQMSEVRENLTEFQKATAKHPDAKENVRQSLDVISPLYNASTVYDSENNRWLSNLGMYDRSVDNAADALYQEKLTEVFMPAFAREIEQDLFRMDESDGRLPDTLKIYLMLFDQDRRDVDAIKTYANLRWKEQYAGKEEIQAQLTQHLNTALEKPNPIAEDMLNTRIVSSTQAKLRRIPIAHRLYAKLKASPELSQNINFYSDIGGDTQFLFGLNENSPTFTVPFIFTKAGFDSVDVDANSDLIQSLSEDQWLYGTPSNNERNADVDYSRVSREIEKLYHTEYYNYWSNFLKSINISKFSSLNEGMSLLNKLSDPIYSPLLAIAEITTSNTKLTPTFELPKTSINNLRAPVSGQTQQLASAAADAAASKLREANEPTLVDIRFKELHQATLAPKDRQARIQGYLQAIAELSGFLSELETVPDSRKAMFDVAKKRFSGSTADAIQALRSQASRAPNPMNRWLEGIADNAWSLVLNSAKNHVNTVWNNQVYTVYNASLAGRYPFSTGTRNEVPMLEFNNYFKPGGIEQSFVDTYVKPFVDTRRWQSRSLDGRSLGFTAESFSQFKQADTIRGALFSTADNAQVNFRLQPLKLDSSVRLFALELGNSRITYSHGPRTPSSLSWTGGQELRSRIIFEDLNETVHRKHFEGDWAWFKLLDASRVEATNAANIKNITFEDNGREAQFKLTANSNINPFDSQLLKKYRAPKTL
ncbi:type VI secretion system membrane subunit TssM [Marinibactrum halimedae]|uniref:Type VI secretion protein IcmF n=1 Tax=Marinibactrum halimedae TaxID=1444977 RepID=A0AA37T6P0_9GAMM|nr:type VI secretion system membrane subunit TssM [Marinibactrum halimedae]MCD9458356.1 type VI secretion system membrane subunit TssM [Marinibactrum halimedae]GLS26053.1 type VI secretion protein IcmF [Marinibactrum halimedae]